MYPDGPQQSDPTQPVPPPGPPGPPLPPGPPGPPGPLGLPQPDLSKPGLPSSGPPSAPFPQSGPPSPDFSQSGPPSPDYSQSGPPQSGPPGLPVPPGGLGHPGPGPGKPKKGKGAIIGIIIGLVLLCLICDVGGGIAGWIYWDRENNNSSDSSRPRVSPTPSAPPVALASVEQVLTAQKFQCSDAVTTPVRIRACYLAVSGGALLSYRIHLDESGQVVGVIGDTAPGNGSRGDGTAVLRTSAAAVAKVLLGDEASKFGVQRSVTAPWGNATFYTSSKRGTADFIRNDARSKVTGVRQPDFPSTATSLPRLLASRGYKCSNSIDLCDKGDVDTVRIKVWPEAERVRVIVEKDKDHKPLVTAGALSAAYRETTDLVLPAADRAAVAQWLAANAKPQYGAVQATFNGVTIRLLADGEDEFEMQMTSFKPWR